MQNFGTDAEAEGADYEGEVEGAPTVGVDYPVEDEGQEEEGEEVQEFVVYEGVELDGGQAGVTCYEEEQGEEACFLRGEEVSGWEEKDWNEVLLGLDGKGGCDAKLWRCAAKGLHEPAKGSRILILGGRYVGYSLRAEGCWYLEPKRPRGRRLSGREGWLNRFQSFVRFAWLLLCLTEIEPSCISAWSWCFGFVIS